MEGLPPNREIMRPLKPPVNRPGRSGLTSLLSRTIRRFDNEGAGPAPPCADHVDRERYRAVPFMATRNRAPRWSFVDCSSNTSWRLIRRTRAQAQRELNDMADRFEDTFGEIHAEMHAVRGELARLRTLDHALLAERDWLN